MSTRVSASARVSAACRQLVNQRLNISLGPAVDLGQLNATLAAGNVDVAGLRAMVTGEVSGVLATLAPASFGRAREILAAPAAAQPPSLLLSARTELASAVTIAGAAIAGATRDITTEAFTEAGRELRYAVSMCRGGTVTGIELRRADEVLLLRVHDGGLVESDHAGLVDGACGDRQRELEQAVARRGIVLTGRKQLNHGTCTGGDLIGAAAALGDQSLARATVTAAERTAARPGGLFSPAGQAEASRRARVRRGGAA